MRYIESPTPYYPGAPNEATLFLAGGITGCSDWQYEVTQLLTNYDITIFNPRRADFDVADPDVEREQIEWEFNHLRQAKAVLFWFAPETLCPITLLEYGKWLVSNKMLFVGVHEDYARKNDIYIQTRLERPYQLVCNNLRSTILEVKDEFWFW